MSAASARSFCGSSSERELEEREAAWLLAKATEHHVGLGEAKRAARSAVGRGATQLVEHVDQLRPLAKRPEQPLETREDAGVAGMRGVRGLERVDRPLRVAALLLEHVGEATELGGLLVLVLESVPLASAEDRDARPTPSRPARS